MLSDFFKNEILMSCEYIKTHALALKEGSVINILGNHLLCDYLIKALENLNDKTEYGYTVYQLKHADALSSTVSKQCFLYCFDARVESENSLSDFKKALDYASNIKDTQFITMVIVPEIAKRDDVHSLCEMELSVISGDYLKKIESTLSSYREKLNIKEIRFDNFLIENSEHNLLNLTKIVKEAVDTGCVNINSSDAFDVISACSMSDAIDAVFTVIKYGKHGNIYNMSGEPMSLYDIKSFVYQTLCEYGINLTLTQCEMNSKKTYRVLDTGKLNSLSYSPLCDNNTRLLFAMSDIVKDKYNIIDDKINKQYNGKLQYIRDMELELLRIVDRICRNNNIQYFLSGGTMLGAVRHKGFIPWDDDVDIAMLREDFVRFKEVCKTELPEKYQYQSFTNRDGYHYFFDKITIKDTYFSTMYSDKFDMLKGISMDIFVFDKTSDKKFFQKLHFKTLMALRLMMNVRWINKPRKDKSYLLSRILLPLLRLFSMDTYSKIYDKVLKCYEKRNTQTVLPPATDHKWRGVMPKKWFESVVDAPFENVSSYIPTGYDNYLKIWYCENYMDLLPLSSRVSTHDFYRLDIGNEIKLDTDELSHYNHKGELL